MPQLNTVQKAQVIAYVQDGMPVRDVAQVMHVNKNTVQKIKHRWEIHGTLDNKKPTGRPRATTQEEDNALVHFLEENPFTVAVKAMAETDFPASRSTACRRIKKSPLKNYVAVKKIILRQEHKQARIIFALNNILREDWNRVIFTDEKVFQSSFNGHIRVYRPRGTRFDEKYTNNSERSGRFSVNVWAWLSYQGLGVCWVIEERFTALSYRNILENVMLPCVLEHFPTHNFILQQDNCPVHNAGMVKEWFQQNNIETLLWPSKSPDINIMENVWGILTKKMYEVNFRPANRNELISFLQETWDELSDSQDLIRNLYSSIPNRLNEILGRNGAMTKY